MKGIPIKFRGKRIDGNGYVYGDLEHKYSRDIWIDCFEVYPESVSQLVGYDVDGKELYEGDEVVPFELGHRVKCAKMIVTAGSYFCVDWKGEPPKDLLTLQAQRERNLNWTKKLKKV